MINRRNFLKGVAGFGWGMFVNGFGSDVFAKTRRGKFLYFAPYNWTLSYEDNFRRFRSARERFKVSHVFAEGVSESFRKGMGVKAKLMVQDERFVDMLVNGGFSVSGLDDVNVDCEQGMCEVGNNIRDFMDCKSRVVLEDFFKARDKFDEGFAKVIDRVDDVDGVRGLYESWWSGYFLDRGKFEEFLSVGKGGDGRFNFLVKDLFEKSYVFLSSLYFSNKRDVISLPSRDELMGSFDEVSNMAQDLRSYRYDVINSGKQEEYLKDLQWEWKNRSVRKCGRGMANLFYKLLDKGGDGEDMQSAIFLYDPYNNGDMIDYYFDTYKPEKDFVVYKELI